MFGDLGGVANIVLMGRVAGCFDLGVMLRRARPLPKTDAHQLLAVLESLPCSAFHNAILVESIARAQHSQCWKVPESSLLARSY